jgi:hypothetical protein
MHTSNLLILVLALLMSGLGLVGAYYVRESWRAARWNAGERLR